MSFTGTFDNEKCYDYRRHILHGKGYRRGKADRITDGGTTQTEA